MKRIFLLLLSCGIILLNCNVLGLYTSQKYCLITFRNQTSNLNTNLAVSTSSYVLDIKTQISVNAGSNKTVAVEAGSYYAFFQEGGSWYYNTAVTECKAGKKYRTTLSYSSSYGITSLIEQ